MIKNFDIYQYIYYNQKNCKKFLELKQYILKNKIKIQENEVIISGRILEGVIGVGDKLFSDDLSRIFCVKNIYCYGNEVDYLTSGMTCAIKVVKLQQKCDLVNTRLLVKKGNKICWRRTSSIGQLLRMD